MTPMTMLASVSAGRRNPQTLLPSGSRLPSVSPRVAPSKRTTPPEDVEAVLRNAAAENQHYDYFQASLNDRAEPPRLRGSSRLLVRALRTVWAAGSRPFLAVVLMTVVLSILTTAQVLVTKSLLSKLLAGGTVSARALLPSVLELAFLAAVTVGLTTCLQQVQRYLGQLIVRHTSRQVLDVTTTVPLDAYETPWFFNYLVRVETNSLSKPLELTQAVVSILSGLTTAAGICLVLVSIEPLLVPMLILSALPTYLVNRVASRWEFAFAVEQSPGLRERNYYSNVMKLRDTAKEVRAFDLAGVLRGRWEDRYAGLLVGLRRMLTRRLALVLVSSAANALLTTGLMLFLLYRVQTGGLSLAQAGAALVALRLLGSRLQATSAGANSLFESRLFLNDLEGFIALKDAFAPPATAGLDLLPGGATPVVDGFRSLQVAEVSYRYPGSDQLALDGVSLELHRGEVIALVGENGSGKTTLAKLLAGLHRPTSGDVLWDGRSTSTFEPDQMRKTTAVVFQDFARYELSARENIAVGRAYDVTDPEAVRRAAIQAGADEFLQRLPSGYDTMLTKALPGGADLSIGQWQRVALARAFYRDAPFVVLDEPTSALDPRAEQNLFSQVRELFKGRAVLLISHRFSSVRSADRIYVLDKGHIVEAGSHEELMEQDGTYAELFRLQAAAYLGEGKDMSVDALAESGDR